MELFNQRLFSSAACRNNVYIFTLFLMPSLSQLQCRRMSVERKPPFFIFYPLESADFTLIAPKGWISLFCYSAKQGLFVILQKNVPSCRVATTVWQQILFVDFCFSILLRRYKYYFSTLGLMKYYVISFRYLSGDQGVWN